VADAVRVEIGAISLQSVYDALNVLVSEKLIRVVDVDCAVGAAPCLTAADGSGFDIDEAEVAYWGRCPDCQRRSRKRSPPAAATHATKQKKRRP
jgi:Fur family ferric uptake transcriptional regulator